MEAETLVKTIILSLLSFQLVETIEKISDITFAKYMENDITNICFEIDIYWNLPLCFGQIHLHWSTRDICYLSIQHIQANVLLQTIVLDISAMHNLFLKLRKFTSKIRNNKFKTKRFHYDCILYGVTAILTFRLSCSINVACQFEQQIIHCTIV